MKWYKNKEIIETSVSGSRSYAQILRKLGLRDNGSSFYTLKKALKKFSIVFKPNYNYPRDTLKIPLKKYW